MKGIGAKTKCVRMFLIVTVIAVLLSGCWDRRELEEQASVIALGLDKYKDGLEMTIQVPIPVKIVGGGGGGGGGGGQETVQLFSATGKNASDALKNLQKQLNHQMGFGHMRVVVVSEELARSGLMDVGDWLERNHQVRREHWPVITEGKASDVLKISPKLTQIPAVYIIDMFDFWTQEERIAYETFGDLVGDVRNKGREAVVNMVRPVGDTVTWTGVALFKGIQMVGKLNEEKSWVLMQLRDGSLGGQLVSGCPNDNSGEVTMLPQEVKRQIKFDKNERKFDILVNVRGSVTEKSCKTDLSQERAMREVERSVRNQYEKNAREIVAELQKNNIDALNLGNFVRGHYPNFWDRIEWEKEFPEATIRIKYNVNIKGRGALYQ